MSKFDHNKVSEYKKFMVDNGIYELKFLGGGLLFLDFEHGYFKFEKDCSIIYSYESFEDFKIEIANYFLNE